MAGHIPRDDVAIVDRVDPALLELMAAWPDNPAVVYNLAYDVLASNTIAGFRLNHGRSPNHPRTRLWNRHEARGKALEAKRFQHHEVGELTLSMQTSTSTRRRARNSSSTTQRRTPPTRTR